MFLSANTGLISMMTESFLGPLIILAVALLAIASAVSREQFEASTAVVRRGFYYGIKRSGGRSA